MAAEVRLPQGRGGSTVWRADDGVHRTTHPWTPTVHAFLRHLEAVGFEGAPRVLGFDGQGREVLTFIEGEVINDPAWEPGRPNPCPEWARTEEVLAAVASLLRELHAAAATFVPTAPVWRYYDWPGLLPGQIVCHGDIGPHNTIYRDGLPVALIDWDEIRPNDPTIEFGIAAWRYIPLGTDDFFAASDWPDRPDLASRLRLFAETYGITDRAGVLNALQQGKQRSLDPMRYWPITPAAAANHLRIVAADLDWLGEQAHWLGSSLAD